MALSETFNTQPDPMEHDLRMAALQGNVAQLDDCLSAHGANPNAVHIQALTKVDMTPAIVLASGAGQGPAVTHLLADERTDPNIADPFGRTAMMEAMFNNETAIIRTLVNDRRTDMGAVVQNERLLHDVVLYERTKVADILGSHPEHGSTILTRLHEIATGMQAEDMAAFCKAELGATERQRKAAPAPKPK